MSQYLTLVGPLIDIDDIDADDRPDPDRTPTTAAELLALRDERREHRRLATRARIERLASRAAMTLTQKIPALGGENQPVAETLGRLYVQISILSDNEDYAEQIIANLDRVRDTRHITKYDTDALYAVYEARANEQKALSALMDMTAEEMAAEHPDMTATQYMDSCRRLETLGGNGEDSTKGALAAFNRALWLNARAETPREGLDPRANEMTILLMNTLIDEIGNPMVISDNGHATPGTPEHARLVEIVVQYINALIYVANDLDA